MDVLCVVCGEPWDYMGARHGGDMLKWEWRLFRVGAGCPGCEGEAPVGGQVELTAEICSFGDEDPILRVSAWEDYHGGKAPKWEKPDPEVFWKCEGCGVEVIDDLEYEGLRYHLPKDAVGSQWYNSHPYCRGDPKKEPAHVFEPDRKVCEFCLRACYLCDADICPTLEYGDTYDDGNCVAYETYHSICVDCFEKENNDE